MMRPGRVNPANSMLLLFGGLLIALWDQMVKTFDWDPISAGFVVGMVFFVLVGALMMAMKHFPSVKAFILEDKKKEKEEEKKIKKKKK
mmetsp:Transcript_18191/g.34444  ORF Transcript_18191/g.34444 Transcript_18191/m.34444 type:complete len:88 (+) Transcript_18191:211-474(+)